MGKKKLMGIQFELTIPLEDANEVLGTEAITDILIIPLIMTDMSATMRINITDAMDMGEIVARHLPISDIVLLVTDQEQDRFLRDTIRYR